MLLRENKSSDFKTLFTKFQDSSNDEPFGKTDAIVVTMGTDEDLVYSKTSALQVSLKFNFFLSSVRGFQLWAMAQMWATALFTLGHRP